ncbi:MAG: efflux RND transporter permease subunit, partial [Alphaproteobacteria bacterium]|nr:efflux RND transporter permease subunit [Alphaproteobacteria bacterium]
MNVFEICIRRPVLASVMSLMLILVGLVSAQRLSVREYPNIDEPIVSVQTTYKGATPEIVETQITQVLEESISGIEGIETLTSSSRSERSSISVRFKTTVNPDGAASDVRDRVSRVRARLPDEIDEPVVAKVEADAQPIIYMAFTSDRHSAMEISDTIDRFVKPRLQTIVGVAEARIMGERKPSMRVWVDRWRLAAYQLTVQDVEAALKKQNVEIPAGRIESLDREFNVLSRASLSTPDEFKRIVVKEVGGFPVRLGQVANVELGPANVRLMTRLNGRTSVSMGIVKTATANPMEVADGVRAALPDVLADLPEGMSGQFAYDTSVFIDRSVKAVIKGIGEAIALVVLVIFFFLRSIRATIVPIVTIPVSLIGACAMMYAFGFTLNTLTLLAFVLAVGLVVDDAIIVLENIHRRIEEGLKPIPAAIEGTKEIAMAVVAMTMTLTAVFAPMAFTTGRTGRLFIEFALTLAGAVIVSGFVALTLTPMMCSKLLREHEKHGRIYEWLESGFLATTAAYRRALGWALSMRSAVVVVGLAVALANVWLWKQLKSELAPIEDRGNVIMIGLAPEGSTLDYTTRYVQLFEAPMRAIPEVAAAFIVAGFP